LMDVMKFLYDFFPILLFFISYKFYDIYVATAVAIVASFVQVGWFWIRHRRIERMHLITLALITILGGATLLLHDATFIKWKPTVVNWAFGLVLLGSQFIGKKPIVQRMMETNIKLTTDHIWTRLNLSWVIFFIALGFINLYVAFNFDENTWVNFKLFGMFGITFLFVIAQSMYLMRYMVPESESDEVENLKP